jgi:chaperonin GroEL
MAVKITLNEEARAGIKNGVDQLANAVKATLGPKGRNAVLQRTFTPHSTKDGVTVAKSIELKDQLENMGAQMVKEVAQNTASEAGDGTTTATILAQAIYTLGLKNVAAGASPIELKRGIDAAVLHAVDQIKNISKDVGSSFDKIEQIATISANNEPTMGKLIADAMQKVTKNGVITVDTSKSSETYVEVTEGMEFDRGYISPYFVTDPEKMETILENPIIIIHERPLARFDEKFINLIDPLIGKGHAILIIAENVEGDALKGLVYNKIKGTAKVCAVKSPGFGNNRIEMLEDIATLTGGEVITETKGKTLGDEDLMLGTAEKVIINQDTTTIIGGGGDQEVIEKRVASLRFQISETTSEYDKEKLQERMSKLLGGVGVLYVGASSEVAMKEKKDRVDDALAATRAAIEEGIVPGGGIALLNLSDYLEDITFENEDQATGCKIVIEAMREPIRVICKNAGVNPEQVMAEINQRRKDAKNAHEIGFDAKAMDYGNMLEKGIIDPAKVVRVALENASDVAGLMLTTEVCVTEIPEHKREEDGYHE